MIVLISFQKFWENKTVAPWKPKGYKPNGTDAQLGEAVIKLSKLQIQICIWALWTPVISRCTKVHQCTPCTHIIIISCYDLHQYTIVSSFYGVTPSSTKNGPNETINCTNVQNKILPPNYTKFAWAPPLLPLPIWQISNYKTKNPPV